MKHKLVSASEAVEIINSGDTIATSGFVGTGTPDALLAEVFTNEGTGTLVVADTKALSPAEQGAL